MLKTERYFPCIFLISVYFHITVAVGSHGKDPLSLLMKLMARNDKSVVIYVDTGKQETGSVNLLAVDDIEEVAERAKDEEQAGDEKNDFDDLLLGSDVGLIDDYYDDTHTLEDNARDQAKYLFYNFLRTSPDQDGEDASLEETKQTLRQALRSRCKKIDTCVKKCPKKKPSCPMNCQQVFDKLDLCDPPKPKKCKKPRCGKTMPPKWLL